MKAIDRFGALLGFDRARTVQGQGRRLAGIVAASVGTSIVAPGQPIWVRCLVFLVLLAAVNGLWLLRRHWARDRQPVRLRSPGPRDLN